MFGTSGIAALSASRVALFGAGGVGSYCAEALIRGGLGALEIIDDDRVCLTNLNRQLEATRKTVGSYKVDALRERLLEINPKAEVVTHKMFYLPDAELDLTRYDYVIDAVDTVAAKLALAENCERLNIPLIAAMGAGNKLDPTRFEVADIYETSECPLCRVMRKELRRRGVKKLKVVYSREEPLTPLETEELSCKKNCVCPPGTERKCTDRRAIPASNSFVPPVAGFILAGEVIKQIADIKYQISNRPVLQ
jgi:tRNA A37 threonylcarbamoyladenosine dehydratase